MFKKYFIVVLFCSLFSAYGQNNILINEFLTSNINGLVDIESGEFSDWIELYNPTNSLIDLSEYFLTDDVNNPTKWKFPQSTFIDSNSYLVLWADDKNTGLHTNFKLSSDGEQLLLFSKDTVIVDSISFGKQREDISYGRDTSLSSTWLYFAEPTPGFINSSNGTIKNNLSDPPQFSQESGFYSSNLILELSAQKEGNIYYTKDATIPTESTGILYNSPINIESTTIIRAIFIENNSLPSKAVSNSYFINENTTLPVISLTTDPKNLWDDKIGINTIGTNGITQWGVNANYWQEWERPIEIEFFEENKYMGFEVSAGIAINGARRNMLPRSYRILARKKYGQESINYKVFPEKEIRNFSSLILRNGGFPDYRFTMLRDGFIQNLMAKNMELEYQAYRPSILFMNGEYWGIFNIREKQNEEYLGENNGVDPKNLDILENNMIVVEGDKAHYEHMINFIKANDLSVKANFDSVNHWMDIDNFTNYQIAQIYVANLDWPANNIKYWRPKTSNGKWRWILFDMDGGFGLNSSYDFNSLEFATEENSTEWNNAPWSTFLFRSLLENDEFKNQFLQRFALHLSYSFNPEYVINIINSVQHRIEFEFPKHINKWSTNCLPEDPETKDGCLPNDINEWYKNIGVMKDFAAKRPQYMLQFLKDYFEIPNTIKFRISTNNQNGGTVYVNGVESVYSSEAIIFPDKKMVVEAIPNSGYRFVKWLGPIESIMRKLEVNFSENEEMRAIFERIDEQTIPGVISSSMKLTKENSPYSTNGDVHIYENSILTINEGVIINLPKGANFYVHGGLVINGTEDEPVQFRAQNIDDKWGAINFVNSTSKSKILHAKITGTTNGKDIINQIGGISSFNSTLEINYLSMENVQFPIFIQYGNFTLRNSKIQTDVTSDLVNVKYGKAIIENCEFIGNYAPDTDAIDYDDVKNGVIRRNKIYNFYGDNSDAIDIGESAKNVLIEDNFINNCSDKGISIGQGSSAIIRGNTIINCNLGIGIKDDQSYGAIDHNTFYNNNISVSCFEKTVGRGGGIADISNSIFFNSKINDIAADQYSEIRVKYSLSDNQIFMGEGNIQGFPNFLDVGLFDFRISKDSPAYDAGDPEYPLDPDGSRTNIGASFTDFDNIRNIIITEINYNSSSEFNPNDWVELYNPTNSDVNLSNWIFKDSNDEHRFILPEGTLIGPKNYLVLCEDSMAFKIHFPNVINIIGDFSFGLNNSGEQIRLFDNYGNIIDSLTYDDREPWETNADGAGYTLQLINIDLDNSDASNWNSILKYGSPGNKNILVGLSETSKIIPADYSLSQNFPNPFNTQTTINFSIPKKSNVLINIFDVLGRQIIKLVDEKKEPGRYSVSFDAKNISSGIYFYQLTANEFRETKKMIFIK